MQIRTTIKYYLTPVGMAIIINSAKANAGMDAEKRSPSYTLGGIANWYRHYGEQNGGSLRNQK